MYIIIEMAVKLIIKPQEDGSYLPIKYTKIQASLLKHGVIMMVI